MRNTRLAGHSLLREGTPYSIDGCAECINGYADSEYGGHVAHGWGGHARCSCGDASPCLDTNSERKRWHAAHKDAVRAAAAGRRPVSDLLSGLPTYDDAGRRMKVWRGQLVKADDVREVLRNPSDGLVEELTAVVSHWLVYEQGDYHRDLMVRAVLAALAGGGDE